MAPFGGAFILLEERDPEGGCSVMFTILTTWISERIITITAVSVLTVAVVPTTLIIVSHDDHNTIAVVQPADEHSKVVLVSAVKKAGDAVIARLNTAEAGCSTQVTQAVTTSKVAAKVQPQLTTAKSQLHGSVAPVVAAIKADEDHLAGTITVICQTVMITITETIQITIIQTTPAPCTKDERDTD